jgi:iron complex outermembrane receptor protein
MRIKANYRHTSGLVAVALASSLAVPALAQDSTSETEFLDNAAQPRGVADIIVTAERRETSVQKSSLAISVVDGDALFRAGVSQARDLAALVPGLQIAAGGVTLQTYVRGIGDFSSSSLGQSAVAYNVDGIYVADTASISTLFYDVARVELLKGPQGTLYGRNSSAGAMNLVLNPPVLGEATGQGTFEVGNYDAVRATLTVNLPLGETVAVRASGNYVTRGGYLSDGTDDDGQRGGRLQLLFEPHAKLSVKIGGDIERRRGSGPGVVLTPRQPGNGKFTGAVDVENNAALLAGAILPPFLVYTPGAGLPPAPGVTSGLLRDTSIDHLQRNVNAEINYDLDFAKVTFLPAYRTSRSSFGNYGSGSPFLNQERTKEQSYELRLSHNSDSLNLVAGLYYLDLRQHTAAQVYVSPLPGLITDQSADLGTKSYAAFGQATVYVSDAFRIIGGGRYTREDRTISAVANSGTGIAFSSGKRFNSFSYRAGMEYDLSPRNMAYVTVSKGFKSGGFNIFEPTATVTNAYDPETLYSYAAGIRNRFLDNRMQLNVEGFYWKYKDSQQNRLAFTPAGNLQFSTFNAASATLYGAEADLIVKPSRADTFTATVSYLHSKFNSFIYEVPFVSVGGTGCVTGPGALGGVSVDCSGRPLPRAPRWSGTASYQHSFYHTDGSSIVVGGDLNFASRRFLAVDYVPNELARAYVRFNANITYNLPDDRFSITAFIKNIGNREVHLGGIQAPFSPGLVYDSVDAPRTYGVRLVGRL